MKESEIKFLDYILPILSENFSESKSLSSLADSFKEEFGYKFSYNELKYILELYNYEHFEYVENTNDNVKITAESKKIIDEFGSLSSYLEAVNENEIILNSEIEEHKLLSKKHLELQNEILQYQISTKEQKSKNDKLTEINLELQNKHLRKYVLYSIISFVMGAFVSNIKQIYCFVASLFE